MAYIGVSPSNGVRRKHTYTATANQTSFSGAGAEGITLGYLDSNYVDVYQNGVKLAEEDYTSTSGTAIVLAQGASADDIVEVVVYDVFSVADTVSKSAGGTFDGNVTMAGTLGVTGVLTGTSLDISGDIDVDGTTNLDVVDIDGAVDMASTLAVAGVVTANGGAVFNEGSANLDFRVETDGQTHALHVDGANNAVTIGGANIPSLKNTMTPILNVSGSGVRGSMSVVRHGTVGGGGSILHLGSTRGSDNNSYTILQSGDGIGTLHFAGADGNEFTTAAEITAKVDGTPGDNDMPGSLHFRCTKDGASTASEYFRLKSNGRLEAQSVSNDGNVLQQFRIDWRNENSAGIMAGIGCVRTANANAPGAFVIRTSTDVDSASNDSDGEISEKFRVAANGDLTATDTSIASNSDSRLKENIADFSYDLTKFKSLKTKTFDWKQPTLHGNKSGVRGFVAQDIETIDDYWIDEVEVSADSDDYQYLEDKDILYTENSTIPVYEEDDTIPDGKSVGDAKYSVGDLEYKARMAKTSKLGQKDAMYVSIIQQLITKIETLETKVATLESA